LRTVGLKTQFVTDLFLFQLLQKYDVEVTFRKVYDGPYFHRHTVNPFIKIIQDTFYDTRSKLHGTVLNLSKLKTITATEPQPHRTV